MNRIVLLVEGEYDGPPVRNLVNHIITQRCPDAFGSVFTDSNALRVGNIPKLSGRNGNANWLRYLHVAAQRADVGGILTVLDGDEDYFEGRPFCAVAAARTLVTRAAEAGAGSAFSLAVVILRQEFESLLIAAADQLPGYDGHALPADIESEPRGAKAWLNDHLADGYKEQHDQLRLTQAVSDWARVSERMRCFRRLEQAVMELIGAVAAGQFMATPVSPPST